jgi:hypothetical protein
MVELHSNFTADGQTRTIDGVYPTNHQQHETLEITRASTLVRGRLLRLHQPAGRPRLAVGRRPHSSPGARAGFLALAGRSEPVDRGRLSARRLLARHLDLGDSPHHRQVIDRWYFAVNPALERTWHGPDVNQGWQFAPAAKVGYDFTKVVSGGIEYYADYGEITATSPRSTTSSSRSFVVTDLNVSPKWEINIGVGHRPDRGHRSLDYQRHSRPPLFLGKAQQTGPRGHDKLFSANWIMPMAQRNWASGELTLRTMLSLEPATISGRYYPELFQQGETAFGRPIVDGQHPHNLFMEIAALYDYKFNEQTILSLYAAPVGDPALGPVAFPHRASASEDPFAPLGHHLEDSTHIADEVLTGGLTWRKLHLEASGFHGREPGENRWIIQIGGLDSWSTRLTRISIQRLGTAQYSIGHLHSPEAQHPAEDVLRQTASIAGITTGMQARSTPWLSGAATIPSAHRQMPTAISWKPQRISTNITQSGPESKT